MFTKMLGKKVLVEVDMGESGEEKTASGIVMVRDKKRKDFYKGVVVQAGEEASVKDGDKILFENRSAAPIDQDEKQFIIRDEEIIGIY